MELISWCIVFVILNCLDLITTYSGMKGDSPDEMKKKELNPAMAAIISNRPLTWGVKLLGVGLLLLVCLRVAEPERSLSLVAFLSIVTTLVVANNLYALWARRHQRLSVGRFFMEKIHLPKGVAYLLVVGTILGISRFVASLLY